ncbi:hypothetical protein C8F01DRAFT_1257172 [Mycena amicta]|nr:hypothetical protein C8F01DRAFT_1257172 [Mycena amicta]
MALPETFDAYPTYVPFDTLHRAVPLDSEHTASFEHSKNLVPHEGFIHSIRCFYFALGILYSGFPSKTAGVPQIPAAELVADSIIPLFFTISGGPTRKKASHTLRMRCRLNSWRDYGVRAPTCPRTLLGRKAGRRYRQSIMLHTIAPEWPSGTSSATAMLMSLSAWFDVDVREIEKEYPRGDFAAEGAVIFGKEFKNKPDCLLSHYPGAPENFAKVVRVGPIVE